MTGPRGARPVGPTAPRSLVNATTRRTLTRASEQLAATFSALRVPPVRIPENLTRALVRVEGHLAVFAELTARARRPMGEDADWVRAVVVERIRRLSEDTDWARRLRVSLDMCHRVRARRVADPAERPTREEALIIVRPWLTGEPCDPHPQGVIVARQWLRDRDTAVLREYIEQSASDRDYWEALDEIVFALIRDDAPLGDDLRDWFVEAHEGVRQPPVRKPGLDPAIKAERDWRLCDAVDTLVALGMPRSRRHSKKDPSRESACELVAAALTEHGVHISYSAVETVWRKDTARRHAAR